MKRIFIVATAVIAAFGTAVAQTPEDALTFSRSTQPSGTARVQSLGGASGALGGEISTIFSNPANIGFYKTGDAVFTFGFNGTNNKSSYFGRTEKANASNGFIGTSGFVFGRPSYGGGSLRGGAIGIAVNKTADFNNKILYRGQNSIGSMGQMFVEDVKAYGYDQFGSDLAYRVYWLDSAGGNLYSPAQSIIQNGGALVQEHVETTSGGITEFAVAGGANINDNVYFGASVGLPSLQYSRTRAFTEADASENGNNHFDYGYFENELTTKGAGINVKAGIVVKPSDNVRFGIAAHSPTFFSLTDHYTAYAEAQTENLTSNAGKRVAASDDGTYNNDGISVSSYNLRTPYKLLGSFALMLGNVHDVKTQKGFITADVEYINYMASTFNSSENTYNSYFKKLNAAIDNAYKGILNARVGAELKFNTFMTRLGGAFYGNPYKDLAGEKADVYQGTLGLGYRNKGFFVDLGYVHTFGTETSFPYRLENRSAFRPASVQLNGSRVILTLGFKI